MNFQDSRFYVALRNVINFIKFRHEISVEMKNPESTFNKLGLKRNTIGDTVYVQLDYDDEKFMSADYSAERMTRKDLSSITAYFDEEINWSDYLSIDVEQFMEVTSGGESYPTFSYAVTITFLDAYDDIKWLLKWLLYVLMGIVGIVVLWQGYLALLHS